MQKKSIWNFYNNVQRQLWATGWRTARVIADITELYWTVLYFISIILGGIIEYVFWRKTLEKRPCHRLQQSG